MTSARLRRDLEQAELAFRRGESIAAARSLERILSLEPAHSKANELMAYLAGNRGDQEGAYRHLRVATADAGASAQSWYYLGICHRNRGEYREASDAIERSLAKGGEFFEGLHDLGVVWHLQGAAAKAIAALDRAIALNAGSFEAHYNRGRAMDGLNRHEEALASYGRALSLNPGHVESWSNGGAALLDLKRHDEALAYSDKALALDPRHAMTWSNRGAVLHELDRLDEALASYDRAVALDPGSALARTFRGAALDDLGRGDEARADYEQALALDPGHPEAQWNMSHAKLVRGEFESGWRLYEARWRKRGAPAPRHANLPRWTGDEDIRGKRILVWPEQGFGDAIQFCRYVPLLVERGAEPVLEVAPPLRGLLSRLPACTVVVPGEEMPDCDIQIPMLSLPLAFGTRRETIPSTIPYLTASAERIRLWEDRLKPADARPRVGIACSGSLSHRNDRNRSMALEAFAGLLDAANLFLVQKELRDPDRRFLEGPGSSIAYLGPSIGDFEDTAAIVAQLDLVVSVDTSLAHLAGALARPVWILLPSVPEWRWMNDRTDSPWYPTATLFRQERRGDWKGLMSRVRQRLIALRPTGSDSGLSANGSIIGWRP